MLSLLFALLGLLLAGVVNLLADDLPQREGLHPPHCPQCGHRYGPAGFLALSRHLLYRGRCPTCDLAPRRRPLLVEISMVIIFALLPFAFSEPANLLLNSFYIAVLVLVIVTDLEHRLIFHAVTFPVTFWAIIGAFFVTDNDWYLALGGAAVGFIIFYLFYWLGRALFGPGALGFGDVTLSMMMGAMLGFHRIIFALVLGILIGGVVSILLVVARRANRRMKLPYGPYLAIAGIIMLIWGMQILDWYAG